MTSAIKVDGKELYKLAHEGKVVERKPRPIIVYSLNEVSIKDNVLVFTCTVSEGTYIRTLGGDIAKKLGTVGYLTALRRLSIGPFMVNNAHKLADITEKSVLDPSDFLTSMKHVELGNMEIGKAKNGVSLDMHSDLGEKILLTSDGESIAIYEKERGTTIYHSLRGLF